MKEVDFGLKEKPVDVDNARCWSGQFLYGFGICRSVVLFFITPKGDISSFPGHHRAWRA